MHRKMRKHGTGVSPSFSVARDRSVKDFSGKDRGPFWPQVAAMLVKRPRKINSRIQRTETARKNQRASIHPKPSAAVASP